MIARATGELLCTLVKAFKKCKIIPFNRDNLVKMQKCQGRFRSFHKRIDAWIHADMWVEEDATSFMASYSKPLFGGHQTALKNSHFLFLGRQPLQHHLLPPAEGPHGRLFALRGQDPPEVPQQELNFSKP